MLISYVKISFYKGEKNDFWNDDLHSYSDFCFHNSFLESLLNKRWMFWDWLKL